MKHQDWLHAQGISVEIAAQHGLIYNGSGAFTFPSGDKNSRRRILFMQRKDGAKTIWDPHTQHLPMPPLFNIPCLELPESREHGVYLSNGEKSTMAMHTAGVVNVVNTFGEGNRIQESIAVLLEHDITRLMVIPDCDTPGLRAAWRWKTLSEDTRLQVEFLDLRLYLESAFDMSPADYQKWDTRDLWLHLNQDKEAFQNALDALPPLDFARYQSELPSYAQQPPPQRTVRAVYYADNEIDFRAAYDAWWFEEVLPLLDRVSPPLGKGRHRHCPNPLHPDHNPSFRISDRGVPQCTCGIQHERKPRQNVAEWVGALSWEDYKKRLITEKRDSRVTSPTAHTPLHKRYHFSQGVPDLLRETILRLKHGGFVHDHAPAILVYDLWHEGIFRGVWTPNTPRTIQDFEEFAAAIQRHTHYKALRLGLAQLTALGFFTESEPITLNQGRPQNRYQPQRLQKALSTFREHLRYRIRERLYADIVPDKVLTTWFPHHEGTEAKILARQKNKQRVALYKQNQEQRDYCSSFYRKLTRYINTTFTLRNLTSKRSSTIPAGSWQNARQYRDLYYLMNARRRIAKGHTIPRSKAAWQIGVSPRTLGDIRDRVKIITEAQFRTVTIKNTHQVIDQLDHAAPWASGRPFGRYLESSGGSTIRIRPDNPEWAQSWASQQARAGHTITGKIQTASLEREASDEEIKELKKTRALRSEMLSQRDKRREPQDPNKQHTPPRQTERVKLPPPERVSPNALTQRYIQAQLSMRNHEGLEKVTSSVLAARIRDLFPFSGVLGNDLPTAKGGKRGNKDDPDDPLLPGDALDP